MSRKRADQEQNSTTTVSINFEKKTYHQVLPSASKTVPPGALLRPADRMAIDQQGNSFLNFVYYSFYF